MMKPSHSLHKIKYFMCHLRNAISYTKVIQKKVVQKFGLIAWLKKVICSEMGCILHSFEELYNSTYIGPFTKSLASERSCYDRFYGSRF